MLVGRVSRFEKLFVRIYFSEDLQKEQPKGSVWSETIWRELQTLHRIGSIELKNELPFLMHLGYRHNADADLASV